MAYSQWHLSTDRYFNPDPAQRCIARELFESVTDLPIVSPHGHVDPRLFVDEDATFGTPADLLIIPDHYVFHMLYSQGVPAGTGETDHRKIWQTFAENFHLFRGTPAGIWLAYVFKIVFGIEAKLNAASAQGIYDQLSEKLAAPEFRPL